MNKKTTFKLFVLAVATVGLSACHHKDDVGPVNPPVIEYAPNKVIGYISGISGKAISGAVVTLNSTTTTSDNYGYYEFDNVTSGTYMISVSAEGMIGESEDITLSASEVTQYYVWNASLYEDRSVNFNYTTEDGGEAETVTESLENNELAEIAIDVNVDADDISEDSQLILTPIYSDESPLLTKALGSGKHMLVGCVLSASNPSAEIVNPINIAFNVGNEDAKDFQAMIYKNGEWVNAESSVNGEAVVVSVKEFGGIGLFADLSVTSSKTLDNLNFTQGYWDNIGGASSIQVENATFEYMTGIEFSKKATNSLEALMIEYVARSLSSLQATKRTGTYPVNVTLPIGYFLRVTGTQEKENLVVRHNQSEITASNYGTCSFYVTSANKDHSGGGDM